MDLDDFDILIPIGLFVGIIQLLIAGVGKINDDSEFKFHPYDSYFQVCKINNKNLQ